MPESALWRVVRVLLIVAATAVALFAIGMFGVLLWLGFVFGHDHDVDDGVLDSAYAVTDAAIADGVVDTSGVSVFAVETSDQVSVEVPGSSPAATQLVWTDENPGDWERAYRPQCSDQVGSDQLGGDRAGMGTVAVVQRYTHTNQVPGLDHEFVFPDAVRNASEAWLDVAVEPGAAETLVELDAGAGGIATSPDRYVRWPGDGDVLRMPLHSIIVEGQSEAPDVLSVVQRSGQLQVRVEVDADMRWAEVAFCVGRGDDASADNRPQVGEWEPWQSDRCPGQEALRQRSEGGASRLDPLISSMGRYRDDNGERRGFQEPRNRYDDVAWFGHTVLFAREHLPAIESLAIDVDYYVYGASGSLIELQSFGPWGVRTAQQSIGRASRVTTIRLDGEVELSGATMREAFVAGGGVTVSVPEGTRVDAIEVHLCLAP